MLVLNLLRIWKYSGPSELWGLDDEMYAAYNICALLYLARYIWLQKIAPNITK